MSPTENTCNFGARYTRSPHLQEPGSSRIYNTPRPEKQVEGVCAVLEEDFQQRIFYLELGVGECLTKTVIGRS